MKIIADEKPHLSEDRRTPPWAPAIMAHPYLLCSERLVVNADVFDLTDPRPRSIGLIGDHQMVGVIPVQLQCAQQGTESGGTPQTEPENQDGRLELNPQTAHASQQGHTCIAQWSPMHPARYPEENAGAIT